MKPVIQIWVRESSLETIKRGHFPTTWWRKEPGEDAVCINVTYDWFVQMRDREKELETNNDLPF